MTTHSLTASLALGLLFGFAGTGKVTAQSPERFVDHAQSMTFESDLRRILWTTDRGCPGGEFPVPCLVLGTSESGDGSSIARLFDSSPGSRDHDFASRVVHDRAYLYWIGASGDVLRVPRHSGTVAPSVIARKESAATRSEIAIDDTHIYWTENAGTASGRLFRLSKTGGGRELMRDNPSHGLDHLRADGRGGVLYITTVPVHILCCASIVERVTSNGAGGFDIARPSQQSIDAFAFDASRLYWITRQGERGRPEVRSAPLDDLTADVSLHALSSVGDPRWTALAVDEFDLYWQESRSVDGSGPIWRRALHGGPAAPITANIPRADALLSTGLNIFAHAAGAILRLPVGAAADPLDIIGDELAPEVVQVIQGAAHDVSLITRKPTFVRVYGRINQVGAAPRSVRVVSPVVLHGSRDGFPLPGSPLRPISGPTLFTSEPILRTDLATTWLFELPRSWLERTITLQSEFNPDFTAAETDLTNNGAERTVTFEDGTGLCVDFLLVSTHAGDSTPGVTLATSIALGRVMSHVERARSVLPTDRIGVAFNGGPPRVRPVIQDPYNLRDGTHKDQLMMNLSVEFTLSGPPTACGDRRTVRVVMAPDSDRFGLSYGSGPYIYFLQSFRGPGVNLPFGGVAGLAHELGHQLGRPHINCWAPGGVPPSGTDGSYPYMPCQIDNTNDHIGLDSLTRQLIVPLLPDATSGATDFMSYGAAPQWASDYTYEGIFDQLRVGAAAAAPLAGDGAPAGGDSAVVVAGGPPVPVLLVSGIVPDGGAPQLSYAYGTAEPAAVAARIAATAVPHPEYELRTYDADGNLLSADPLQGGELEAEDGSHALLFTNLFADPPDTPLARVEVAHTALGTVIDRTAGAARPDVTVDRPAAGDMVEDELRIEWLGGDSDGDDVRYAVRYSHDDGRSWTPLGSGLRDAVLVVDTATLPGGDRAFVEVIASDGLHSATAAAGPFTVRAGTPQPAIFDFMGDPLGPDDTTTLLQSELLELNGRAYDAEDGDLPDEALSWALGGPESRAADGAALRLRHLTPGRYDVELAAIDDQQMQGATSTAVVVLPKQVAPSVEPVLDGRCDDDAHGHDGDPVALTYDDGRVAEVRGIHTEGALYFCFDGLAPRTALPEWVTVQLDPDRSGGNTRLYAVSSDGSVFTEGDGKEPVGGLTAVVSGTATSWSAEMRIERDDLSFDDVFRARLAHIWEGESGAPLDAAWPRGSTGGDPDTWGDAQLADGQAPSPPVVTVPGDIVVEATSADGAVVHYEARVFDATDSEPTLECDPPSGALFPVGVTTVTCVGRASTGLETVARFSVIVRPLPLREQIRAVRDTLALLLSAGTPMTITRIGQAVGALDNCLDPGAWLDGNRLHEGGHVNVFAKLAQAVHHLETVDDPQVPVSEPVDALAALAPALAQVAIDDAEAAIVAHADGDSEGLKSAGKALGRALEAMDEGAADQAWTHAQHAIRHALRA